MSVVTVSRVCAFVLFSTGLASVACGSSLPPQDENGTPGSTEKNGAFGTSSSSGQITEATTPQCGNVALAAKKTPVDVILAIDTSGSMNEEMVQVRTNINAFVAKLAASGLDYRLSVIGGKNSGQNTLVVPEPLAGPNGADKEPAFHHLATQVDSNNAWGQIMASYALWKPFTRTEAFKVFIVFSDDEANYTTQTNPQIQFDTDIIAKGGFGTKDKRNYKYNAVVGWKEGTPLTQNTKCTSAVAAGLNHRTLATLTGGIVDSICKTDFSSVFDSISKATADQLACDAILPAGSGADASKVVVTAGGTQFVPVTDAAKCSTVPNGWYFGDSAKTQVKLCDSACTTARTASKLDVSVGCVSVTPR